jgi:hypothetical protein
MIFVHFPPHTSVTICYILPIACPTPPIRGDIVHVWWCNLVRFLLYGVDERFLLTLIVMKISVGHTHTLCIKVLESVAHPHNAGLGRIALFFIVASLDVADSTTTTTAAAVVVVVAALTAIQTNNMNNPNPKGQCQ